MYSIYSALSCGNSLNEGIKSINVFYDTLFVNFKSWDSVDNSHYENLLIEKVSFDYVTNSLNTYTNGHLLNFGDTGTRMPFRSNGNVFIDNILLENKKTVLICGLSSITQAVTARAGVETVSGNAFIPVVYSYNINDDTLKHLYPPTNAVSAWSRFVFGNYLSGQTPLVSYNVETNSLNFIIKSEVKVKSPSVKNLDVVNDIMFSYDFNNLSLTNVRQLTALKVGDNFMNYDYVKFKNYNDNKKLIVSSKNDAVQVFTLL
jgi:hypothetical protein